MAKQAKEPEIIEDLTEKEPVMAPVAPIEEEEVNHKEEVFKTSVIVFKLRLIFEDFKYKLDKYEIDEDGDVIYETYSKKSNAESLMKRFSEKGILMDIKEVTK